MERDLKDGSSIKKKRVSNKKSEVRQEVRNYQKN